MTHYSVNATVSFSGWIAVEAESPEEAQERAAECDATDFDYDTGTASVEFNVTPAVEERHEHRR